MRVRVPIHNKFPGLFPAFPGIILVFIIIQINFIPIFAGNNKIDSLRHILTTTPTDTGRINILNKLSNEYSKPNPDSGVFYAQKALEWARKINYSTGMAKANYLLGNICFDKGNYKNARAYFEKSLSIYKNTGDIKGIADNYLNFGHLYNNYYEINRDSSKIYYELALKKYETIKDIKGIALVYNGIAVIHYFNCEYEKAIEYYNKAKVEFEKINDNEGIGNAYNNIALAYTDQGIYVPALDYFLRASLFYEKTGNKMRIANNASSIGNLYLLLFDFKNAEKNFNKALLIFEKLQNPLYLTMVHDNFGELYNKQGKYRLSLNHYLFGYKNEVNADNDYYIAYASNNLAVAYLNLGILDSAKFYSLKSYRRAQKGNYKAIMSVSLITIAQIYKENNNIEDAIKYGEQAMKLLSRMEEKGKIEVLSGLLSELYAKKKDFKKAYEYHVIYKNATDSLLNAEKIRTITGKEYEFNYAKKQREQELLQQQQKKLNEAALKWQKTIRNYWTALACILVLIALLIYINYRSKRKDNILLKEKNQIISEKNQILNQQKEELSEANSAKDKFFSIIAHDLKNPLNAMIGFSELLENRYDLVDITTQKKYIKLINQSSNDLYKLLENLLQWSNLQTGKVSFNPSKFYLIDVIKPVQSLLEPVALKKNITVHNYIDKTLPVYADYSMIATVLRNLINNAIKFTPDNGNIFLESERIGNFIKVSIRDDGIGINEKDLLKIFRMDIHFSKKGTSGEKGTGLGLLLCKEFIEKNKGQINIISKEGKGATFWFTLPGENYNN
jgi:signal transduction histidine kinase/tetratricopeptide (TPR) repeat protein